MVFYPILLFEKDQGISIGESQLINKKYGFVKEIVKPLIFGNDYLQIISKLSLPNIFFKDDENERKFAFRAKPSFSTESNSQKIGSLEKNIGFGDKPEENFSLIETVVDSLYNELKVQAYSEFALNRYQSQQLGLVIKPKLYVNANMVGPGTILNIGFEYDSILIPDTIFERLEMKIRSRRVSLMEIEPQN
jgi:hypothetical protein